MPLFFLLKISNQMHYYVLILTLDVINFKIYLGSSSKAMTDRENKRGRWT